MSRAVAGDDGLERVACAASDALGDPVVIVLPSLGAAGRLARRLGSPQRCSESLCGSRRQPRRDSPAGEPDGVAHAVPIRIGADVVGIVAAIRSNGSSRGAADDPAWLEAAAAAAAVTRLMGDGRRGEEHLRVALLRALVGGPPADEAALIADGRRLGVDLAAGAIAVCARAAAGEHPIPDELAGSMIAELEPGCVVGLVPLAGEPAAERDAAAVAERLQGAGFDAAGVSAARREPSLLREAIREAMLLAELALAPEAALAEQEETYRLLIGVLLRDPGELELLRSRTITPLTAYDAEHDTDLLVTLGTFLAHHGSTTETAEAMGLHRHTVGYRLSRVHEVSGLSPYEIGRPRAPQPRAQGRADPRGQRTTMKPV